MPLFAHFGRVLVPECMDDPQLSRSKHVAALRGLARINRVTAADRLVWPPVQALAKRLGRPIRVLDVATGDGGVLRAMARRAGNHAIRMELAGCDVSRRALAIARLRGRRSGVPARFIRCDVLRDRLPDGYDVVMCALFLHHLSERDAVVALQRMAAAARHTLIVSDLQRTRFGLLLAQIGTSLLSGSPVVHFDGPQSVRAAFTVDELRTIAESAGLRGAILTRHFPARVRLVWNRPE